MKKRLREYIYALTMIMLVALLFLQVKWISFSFRAQEKVFRNSVDLALDRSIAGLNSDQQVCDAMRECMMCDSLYSDSPFLSPGVWSQIRSTIDRELEVYDIDPVYDLFITGDNGDTIRSGHVGLHVREGNCYTQSLREVLQTSGYQLVVSFPDKTRFYLSQAGLMLFSSVVLILLIILSIFRIVKWFRSELRLADNIKELINNVTHEFKTPITSIALASNMIRKGRVAGQPAKIVEYGEMIFRENRRLEKQVESLLDLAAIERDDFDYRFQPVRFGKIINEAVESVKLLAEEKGGVVNCELTLSDETILADRLQMTNAVVNLLVNALKYSVLPPEVNINDFRSGKMIALAIKDNGIGIPLKYQKYVFDKYYRIPTGDVHDIKGFGIGLSYVKKVVEAHQGKIILTSEPGKGSVFTLFLPAADFE